MRANHTIFIILLIKIIPMSSECSNDHSAYHKFSDSCMGTTFTLLIDHDNIDEAKKGALLAFKEAHRLNLYSVTTRVRANYQNYLRIQGQKNSTLSHLSLCQSLLPVRNFRKKQMAVLI